MKVRIHIDRVVLDGLPMSQGEARLVGAAMEAELGRLVNEGGLLPELTSGLAVPEVGAPPVQLGADGRGDEVGRGIAGAVYGGIGR